MQTLTSSAADNFREEKREESCVENLDCVKNLRWDWFLDESEGKIHFFNLRTGKERNLMVSVRDIIEMYEIEGVLVIFQGIPNISAANRDYGKPERWWEIQVYDVENDRFSYEININPIRPELLSIWEELEYRYEMQIELWVVPLSGSLPCNWISQVKGTKKAVTITGMADSQYDPCVWDMYLPDCHQTRIVYEELTIDTAKNEIWNLVAYDPATKQAVTLVTTKEGLCYSEIEYDTVVY